MSSLPRSLASIRQRAQSLSQLDLEPYYPDILVEDAGNLIGELNAEIQSHRKVIEKEVKIN